MGKLIPCEMDQDVEGSTLVDGTSVGTVNTGNDESVLDILRRRRDKSPNAGISRPSGWYILLFGQFIALVASSQNAASFTLEHTLGRNFPFFMMLCTNSVLSLHLFWSRGLSPEEAPYHIPLTSIRLRVPWWFYLCHSAVGVCTGFLNLTALRRTSLTSVTLLTSLTVPWNMFFCRLFLGKVYRLPHFFGVAMCLAGGIFTIWTDVGSSTDEASSTTSHPHSYIGDICAILAATAWGAGDAISEFWCKHVDWKEYMGMHGFFGTMYCSMLVLFLERDEVLDLFQDSDNFWPTIGVMVLYVIALVAYCDTASVFLITADATFMNLSLQTSNLWAICFSIVAFRDFPPLIFYVSAVLVMIGVFVYELIGNASLEEEGNASREASSTRTRANGYETVENSEAIVC